MATIASVFVIGLSFGFILFLLAAGMTLTMGLMRIVNMAHGALYMVGGYVGIYVVNHTHNFWIGLIAAAACAGLIGMLLEVGFLRRLYNDEASQVLLTIGFIYILANVTQWIFGTIPFSGVTPKLLSTSVPVGSVELPLFRLFIIGFGLVMAVLLWLFQDKTKVGAWVRAGMDNREITGTLGINLKVLFTGIFALGSLIAGLCGLLGTPVTGMNLGIGWAALLFSLIVVVIGGTGSIQGALLGGIIIGLLNAFGGAYFPQFADYVIYVALIVILLIRPSGLLGRKMEGPRTSAENLEKASAYKKKQADEGQASRERAGASAVKETPSWQKHLNRLVPYLLVLVVLVLLPPFLSHYFQSMMTKVLIFAIFAMSLDLVMGYTGLISFGWAAFFGAAGYALGILIVHGHISLFWVVLPASLAITAVLAAGIGYFCLRVSGIYFLLVTMAFAQLLLIVATKWYSLTGGRDGLVGIPRPDLGFSVTWTNLKFYYFVFIGFIVCYYILHRIAHSSFGRTLVGIRENEPRMRSLGYNTWQLKYMALIVGGIFAGVAGVFFAYFYGSMVPSYFALETSALPMLMVIMGGAATLWGPCLGAAVIVLVQSFASIYSPDRWPLILGAIFVVCVMFIKGGFARHLARFWGKATPQLSPDELQDAVGNEGES
jgi:branched-chain amino acid transport system permease protein